MYTSTFLLLLINLITVSPFRSESLQTNKDKLINNQSVKVDPFNLEILPPSSGIQFFKDGIIFLSSSKASGIIPKHVSFGQIITMYARLTDSTLHNPQLFSSSLNFLFPTEASTFSSDYRTMYFTKYSEDQNSEKIFQANFEAQADDKGDWKEDENYLSFCSGNSIYTHPTLSSDGKIMIFASNMPGSTGGMDLFISQKSDDSWSTPVSLGNAINTTNDELFPYLDKQSNLYFSSNGIPGFGGYDIFVCKFKDNTWIAPANLSSPVNTAFDDVAFKLSPDEKFGFYTVKQKYEKKPMMLYRITFTETSGSNTTLSEYFTNPEMPNTFYFVNEPAVEATNRMDERYPRITDPKRKENEVVYRVQFLTSFNPKTRFQIESGGRFYEVFEYLYSGAYRLCIGEFNSLNEARNLQNLLLNDYPQAYIVAFRNNVISLDPDLFKGEPISSESKNKISPGQKIIGSKNSELEKISQDSIANFMVDKEGIRQEKAWRVSIEPTQIRSIKEDVRLERSSADRAVASGKDFAINQTNAVVYRIQFVSSTTKKGSYNISVGGKNYKTWEYFYNGAYRSTIGEFKTIADAISFQNTMRKSGFTQAFVVAFKNNIRSTDPALFK